MGTINIAEILENFPKGTKLYSPIFGDVYLDKIRPHFAVVVTMYKEREDVKEEFLYDGRYGMNGECMLFPSKENRDWNTFKMTFNDGDIVATTTGTWIGITTGGGVDKFIPTYCVIKWDNTFKAYFDRKETWVFHRLATEEEKQKLFAAIKANGYKWNAETKTLEKLVKTKFKVGNIVQSKYGDKARIIKVSLGNKCYGYKSLIDNGIGGIAFSGQNDWELVPNKFDITTLVPFESRVLVRGNGDCLWKPAIFGCFNDYFFYVLGGNGYKQCIPYENNAYLLGTTNDCDDYYKTWE